MEIDLKSIYKEVYSQLEKDSFDGRIILKLSEWNKIQELLFNNALNRYQKETERTAGKFENNKLELIAWAMGIGGESGEYIDGLKKHLFHGHNLNIESQAKELGDILFYIARSAAALNYSLAEIAEMNIDKLKRRYPDGFDEQKSINRDE